MPWFVFEVGDAGGDSRVERVVAEDRESAARLLRARGYLSVTPRPLSTLADDLSPGDEPPSPRWWSRGGIWVALALVFFACFSGLLPGWGAALVGVPLAVWSLLDEPRRGPLPAYQRLLAAHGACRHYEVLRLAEELRSMEPALTTLARRDVDFRAAGALWALERDAEAEALVRLHAAMGEKAWRTRRACSLAYAHRREAVEEMRRAAALAPSRGEDRIELAQMVLEHEGAVSEARALLNRGQTLNPIAIAFRSMVSGRVAIEEEDYERARSELRRAARWVRWLPLGPSRPEMNALIDVHICMADALAGRPVSAALLERSRAQLERSGRSDLLVRCERALADRRIAYR